MTFAEIFRYFVMLVLIVLAIGAGFDLVFKSWFTRKLDYRKEMAEAIIACLKGYKKEVKDGQDQSLSGVRTGEEGRSEPEGDSKTV